jgi:ornithine cyclodeaminase
MAVLLTQSEVRALLPMRVCMDLMRDALRALAAERAVNPLRWIMRIPGGDSLIGLMPGCLTEGPQALGLKAIALFPGNHGSSYDTHQGVVVLFDPRHGVPTAILDASEITAIRTAAVSGVATDLLARPGATDVAILGSGVQARTHLEAMRVARDVRRVRVFSPDAAHREAFAERQAARHGIEVVAVDSARAAVEGADIVCTVTSSRLPVLSGEWIAAGAHVNAVGSSQPHARELDAVAVARARLFVDRRESALNEAGDFLQARSEGLIDDAHIQGEIGELLLGKLRGRESDDEITLFKSLGLAVEDLAAAEYVRRQAEEREVGTRVAFGGSRDD